MPGYAEAAHAVNLQDIASWETFHDTTIGTRKPSDITVAYLAGPEPENDFKMLLDLGVRPENIWAFEIEKNIAKQGLSALKKEKFRGIKFIPISIEDYFINTPRRFDIIYFDACGPFPSAQSKTARVLMTLFRYSALSPLGVLVSNFSRPDVSKESELDRYSFLVAAYLYPKGFLARPLDDCLSDGAMSLGFDFNEKPSSEEVGDSEPDLEYSDCGEEKDFIEEVKNNFDHYYGTFITRSLMDISAIIAPTARLAGGDLFKVLFKYGIKEFIESGTNFISSDDENVENHEGYSIEYATADHDSLIWTLIFCDSFEGKHNFDIPEPTKKFLREWCNAMGGKKSSSSFQELVLIYYAWRHDTSLWSDAMQKISKFPYSEKMPFLCDVPNQEIGFYSAFAQLAYPAHANIRETRRYCYVAEGKQTPMFMDVIAFDECRYVYDWLSALHLTPEDWSDVSTQLVFRFALDSIVKEKCSFSEDYFYGCHVVGINSRFPASILVPRKKISKKRE